MKFVNPIGRTPGSGVQPSIMAQLSRQKSKVFIMN